jgi:hypothetical protein
MTLVVADPTNPRPYVVAYKVMAGAAASRNEAYAYAVEQGYTGTRPALRACARRLGIEGKPGPRPGRAKPIDSGTY